MKLHGGSVHNLLALSLLPVMSVTGAALLSRPQIRSSQPGGSVVFALQTKSFSAGGEIPRKYTCVGKDVSPELSWSEPPAGTQSLALVVDDPDAPSGTFTHWLLYDLPPSTRQLAEGASQGELPGARQGRNDFGNNGYGGPCPPPGKPHRYYFKLYALDKQLGLKSGANRQQLEQAVQTHILAHAEVTGTFRR